MSNTPITPPTEAQIQRMAAKPHSAEAKATRARLRAYDAATRRDVLAAQIAELEKSAPPAPTAAEQQYAARATANPGGVVRNRAISTDHPAMPALAHVEAHKRASAELERLREEHARFAQAAEESASALPSLEAEYQAAVAAEDAQHAAKQGREAQLTDRFNYSHKR